MGCVVLGVAQLQQTGWAKRTGKTESSSSGVGNVGGLYGLTLSA